MKIIVDKSSADCAAYNLTHKAEIEAGLMNEWAPTDCIRQQEAQEALRQTIQVDLRASLVEILKKHGMTPEVYVNSYSAFAYTSFGRVGLYSDSSYGRVTSLKFIAGTKWCTFKPAKGEAAFPLNADFADKIFDKLATLRSEEDKKEHAKQEQKDREAARLVWAEENKAVLAPLGLMNVFPNTNGTVTYKGVPYSMDSLAKIAELVVRQRDEMESLLKTLPETTYFAKNSVTGLYYGSEGGQFGFSIPADRDYAFKPLTTTELAVLCATFENVVTVRNVRGY
jgi:hypothetical protein